MLRQGKIVLVVKLLFQIILLCSRTGVLVADSEQISHTNIVQLAAEAFFRICDTSENSFVSESELSACFEELKRQRLANADNTINSLLGAFDKNRDKRISRSEYSQSLKSAITDKVFTGGEATDQDDSPNIKITLRDGTVKYVTQAEMLGMMKSNMADFGDLEPDAEGRYMKDDKGKKSLDQLEKENPQLAQFISVGKWCMKQLMPALHATNSTLLQLRSLPVGGSPNRANDQAIQPLFGSTNNAWLEMKISINVTMSRDKSTDVFITEIVNVEVMIYKDTTTGKGTELKIESAWLLNEDGTRARELQIFSVPGKKSTWARWLPQLREILISGQYITWRIVIVMILCSVAFWLAMMSGRI